MFGGCPQPRLLAPIDAFSRTSVVITNAVTDLDEHDHRTILHDQVDFAERRSVVTFDQLEPGAFEIFGSAPLRGGSARVLSEEARRRLLISDRR